MLAMLSTGADFAMVMRYLRHAEEDAFGIARSTGQERHALAHAMWQMLTEAATRVAMEPGGK